MTVVFVELPNTKIELLEPLGDDSPIGGFLEKTPRAASTTSATRWPTSLPRAITSRRRGPRGWRRQPQDRRPWQPVLFLHPKDFCGTLVELEQA